MNGFVVDITAIINGGVLQVERRGVVEGLDYTADILLTGSAVNEESQRFGFTGRLSGSIHASCARCLKPVTLPYESEIEFSFTSLETEQEDDVLVFTGSNVDFSSVVAGFVKADAPISVLCGEDCKGLCQKCGQDLNVNQCGCEIDLINPVLDKSIFN